MKIIELKKQRKREEKEGIFRRPFPFFLFLAISMIIRLPDNRRQHYTYLILVYSDVFNTVDFNIDNCRIFPLFSEQYFNQREPALPYPP